MLSAKECKHYFKNDFILDFLKENDMQSSKFWHEGCSTHYIGLYKTWMLCCWAVLPSLCHLYKTAFSLLMPSKYSAQKTFQFHGLKAVLVRKNFCLKEMYKTISWGVGKPNMNIAIFIGGKKNRHKSSLTYARFSHSLPSHSFTTKLDISLQKNFPSIEFDNKRGGSLIIEEETATFYNLFLQELHFSIF